MKKPSSGYDLYFGLLSLLYRVERKKNKTLDQSTDNVVKKKSQNIILHDIGYYDCCKHINTPSLCLCYLRNVCQKV